MTTSACSSLESPLDAYLRSVARGLWAIGPARRREVLRTLRADLLDLAEDRGFRDGEAFTAFLRDQPSPAEVARNLQKAELDQAYWRVLVALLPMALAGLWTVVSTPDSPFVTTLGLFKQAVWYASLTYLHFALRAAWAQQKEPKRLLWGLLLGALGGFVWWGLNLNSWPQFLTLQPLSHAFYNSAARAILTGAFLGFTVERVASRRRWWALALDAPLYMALLFAYVNSFRPLPLPPPRPGTAVTTRTSKAVPKVMATATRPPKPIPSRFIPLTIGLQAVLWAGARSSRRLGLIRLFRKGGPGGGPQVAG